VSEFFARWGYFLLLLGIGGGALLFRGSRIKSILSSWATANDFEIIHRTLGLFRPGPFFFTLGHQVVYFLQVRDRQGRERACWVRLGGFFTGLLSDKIEVRWMQDEPVHERRLPADSALGNGRLNWKWLSPRTCVAVLLAIVAFAAGLTIIVEAMFKSSDAYHEALRRARSSSVVSSALGLPLREGFFVTGNAHFENSSGHAELTIPLSGPRGKGSILVEAAKENGSWTFSTLMVQVEKSGKLIDLLHDEK
jgi:hypothetical protein